MRTEGSEDPLVAARPAVGYRTFSPKLAPGLHAAGALLLLVGALGLHLRVTRTISEGAVPEDLNRVWGYAGRPGWVIAITAAVALVAAAGWRLRPVAWRAAPIVTAALGIGLAAWRLRVLDARASEIVADAEPSAELFSLHAGFGWGAWLLLAGAILLGLAVLAGGLRELDVRRGGAS